MARYLKSYEEVTLYHQHCGELYRSGAFVRIRGEAAVVKESEKALQLRFERDGIPYTLWIPKSCLEVERDGCFISGYVSLSLANQKSLLYYVDKDDKRTKCTNE